MRCLACLACIASMAALLSVGALRGFFVAAHEDDGMASPTSCCFDLLLLLRSRVRGRQLGATLRRGLVLCKSVIIVTSTCASTSWTT